MTRKASFMIQATKDRCEPFRSYSVCVPKRRQYAKEGHRSFKRNCVFRGKPRPLPPTLEQAMSRNNVRGPTSALTEFLRVSCQIYPTHTYILFIFHLRTLVTCFDADFSCFGVCVCGLGTGYYGSSFGAAYVSQEERTR